MMATTKPSLPSLKTPLSAGFPSEMRSPCVGTPTYIKQEESQKRMGSLDHLVNFNTESFSGDLADQSIADLVPTVLHTCVTLIGNPGIIVASELLLHQND